jgi:uncharacterized SAM-binding protein YcdF (DUF218 family)
MFLSAVLTLLISPLGTAVATGLAGLLLALVGQRRLAFSAGVFAIGWIGCWSLPPVADWITGVASGPYRAAAAQGLDALRQLPRAEAIVVLGGGIAPANAARALPDLNEASDRIWQAARLFHAGRAPLILASGGHDLQASRYSEAQAMRRLLLDLAVPAEAILLEESSRNTRQNAIESAALLKARGIRRILLVTSATHMDRALGHFRETGLEVNPAPADFQNMGIVDARRWLPNADALAQSARSLKEWVGQRVW